MTGSRTAKDCAEPTETGSVQSIAVFGGSKVSLTGLRNLLVIHSNEVHKISNFRIYVIDYHRMGTGNQHRALTPPVSTSSRMSHFLELSPVAL